jgi:hypothetical protein
VETAAEGTGPRAALRLRSISYSTFILRLRSGPSLLGMALHFIAVDLEQHRWYEELFVQTIADVEAFVAEQAATEEPAES